MARVRTSFFCTECGAESPRWEGRCPTCGAWNAMTEAPVTGRAGARSAAGGRPGRAASEPLPLGAHQSRPTTRLPLRFGETDRVLGGGLVPGSLVLLGGAPGVGKSTLALQVAARVAADGKSVLYVSGEESGDQVRLRADRVGAGAGEVRFMTSTSLNEVLAAVESQAPDVLCVDSIQTLASDALPSSAGSVAQVRECAAALQAVAKAGGPATLLVGHVTKGGALAGPRTLEHIVDVVLHLEGQRAGEHRILRGSKNRFGSAEEVAVFRMTASGLDPVADPAAIFLSDRPEGASGSAVAVPLHGTRPLPAEVQALTVPSRYGSPQRVAMGFPPRRLSILLAVLERHAGLAFGDVDVFVSVVGGLRLADPAADLAVVAALISARLDVAVPAGTAWIGEVGLGGELRGVSFVEARVREAVRAGLPTAIVPASLDDDLAAAEGARFVESVREVAGWIRSER